MIKYCLFLFLVFSGWGCLSQKTQPKQSPKKIYQRQLFAQYITPKENIYYNDSFCTQIYFGYRFQIQGDFDGDGSSEKLYEKYWKNGKDVPKFYPVADFLDYQVDSNGIGTMKDPTGKIADLTCSGHLGFRFIESLPDINNNGIDEIGYVNHYADMSSMNDYVIVEFRNGKWEWVYSFGIRDWELPYIPWYTERPSQNQLREIILSEYSRVTKVDQKSFEYEGFLETEEYHYKYRYKELGRLWFEVLDDRKKTDKIKAIHICNPYLKDVDIMEAEGEPSGIFCVACSFFFRVTWK